jgi:hypothetical protein
MQEILMDMQDRLKYRPVRETACPVSEFIPIKMGGHYKMLQQGELKMRHADKGKESAWLEQTTRGPFVMD